MRYLVIRTEKLTKTFRRQSGVEDIRLEVEPGEVFGVLGPQDAGKTTLVRLLMDFIRPTSGWALVLGQDVHKHSVEIRRRIGFLPSHFSVYPWMTAEGMLRYLAGLRPGVNWADAVTLADEFHLDLSRRLVQASPLERQKLGLVQAFMGRPDLLILDDPAQHLDPASLETFFRLVARTRVEGRSVFYTSDSIAEMERVCDRVAILNDGRIVTVERGVHLRNHSLRQVELRFACPVSPELFQGLPNLEELRVQENLVHCLVRGNPEPLIRLASQLPVADFICQHLNLEETLRRLYGVTAHAAL